LILSTDSDLLQMLKDPGEPPPTPAVNPDSRTD
jgi:hypothetical protein